MVQTIAKISSDLILDNKKVFFGHFNDIVLYLGEGGAKIRIFSLTQTPQMLLNPRGPINTLVFEDFRSF